MTIDILTLFPELINGVMTQSIIGRAQTAGLITIRPFNIRDYTTDKHNRVDDTPYGGGKGMVMQADPLYRCHYAVTKGQHVHTILMSAQGQRFSQEKARQLLRDNDHLILVCGHYEGIDQRFIDECVDEEISLGDFVLTGGEIPAMAVADAICRMVPGVLSDEVCFTDESHWSGLLEYPQYTKPAVWHSRTVPEVLLSGRHERIDTWRRKQSLQRTHDRRPDLFEQFTAETKRDQKLLKELKQESSQPVEAE
ncbi:MAG: tRNA (guanosine(37)-N1)-methyltransferase TrmD [Eubacterium sp.]|nr:tRNA (guanosine(37)-N1)-methyltransferase TrmD [Eubacterium sp.]